MNLSKRAFEGERRARRRQRLEQWVIFLLIIAVTVFLVWSFTTDTVLASPDCPNGGECWHPRPTPTATVDPLPLKLWLPIIEAHRGWLPWDQQSNPSPTEIGR